LFTGKLVIDLPLHLSHFLTQLDRARCFRDAAERDHFYNLPDEEQMSLEFILDTLVDDLAARKRCVLLAIYFMIYDLLVFVSFSRIALINLSMQCTDIRKST
jgi:hypothetical protein